MLRDASELEQSCPSQGVVVLKLAVTGAWHRVVAVGVCAGSPHGDAGVIAATNC